MHLSRYQVTVTEWGSCGDDGRQARLGWNAELTVTEDRPCDDEGEWWMESDDEVLEYDDLNDSYWGSDDIHSRDTDWMGKEIGT